MARTLIVVGDALQAGGSVLTGSPQTDIEGRAVARIGDRVICARHGPGSILTGDATLVIDGQPVARHGDKASCGCALLAGKQQLAHVSAGGARLAAAPRAGRLIPAIPTLRPLASSPVDIGTSSPAAELCWLNDHSCQVLENPDGRYFESYDPEGARLEYDLVSSFRIDVPLKSGGDILVTAKIKVDKQRRVSDSEVEVAKERLLRGISRGLNNKFALQAIDGPCGSRTYPIRYAVEFVAAGEDYVMRLHDSIERAEVVGNIIYVSVDTDAWVHVHEFMHCLGLPDEYTDEEEEATDVAISFFMPNGRLSPETIVARPSRSEPDPEATLMSEHHNTVLKPRHAWNIGLEVQQLLSRETGREVACQITCSS